MLQISDYAICTTSTIREPESAALLRQNRYNECAAVLFSANIRIFPVQACHSPYPHTNLPVKAPPILTNLVKLTYETNTNF